MANSFVMCKECTVVPVTPPEERCKTCQMVVIANGGGTNKVKEGGTTLNRIIHLRSALDGAFVWSYTKRGQDYWKEVYRALDELENPNAWEKGKYPG